MNKRATRNEHNSSNGLSASFAFLGILISVLWMSACIAGFFFVPNWIAPTATPTEKLNFYSTSAWPLAVVAVAGPAVILIWFAGLRTIRDIVSIRDSIGQFGDLSRALEQISNSSSAIKSDAEALHELSREFSDANRQIAENINTMATQMKEWSDPVELAKELHRLTDKLAKLGSGGKQDLAEAEIRNIEEKKEKRENFNRLIRSAFSAFKSAVDQYNQAPGKGNFRIYIGAGASSYSTELEQLQKKDHLTEAQRLALYKVFDMDVRSRFSARENLEDDEIRLATEELYQAFPKLRERNLDA